MELGGAVEAPSNTSYGWGAAVVSPTAVFKLPFQLALLALGLALTSCKDRTFLEETHQYYFANFSKDGKKLLACTEHTVFKNGTTLEKWTKIKNMTSKDLNENQVLLESDCRTNFPNEQLAGPCVLDDGDVSGSDLRARANMYFGAGLRDELRYLSRLRAKHGEDLNALGAHVCASDHGKWNGKAVEVDRTLTLRDPPKFVELITYEGGHGTI
ncbi:MAG TPA: hypothetical protein VN764_12710, partial [Polyangiaceae bacterium]|nr:hypothetical protein [Polyangiaceae bacterium]